MQARGWFAVAALALIPATAGAANGAKLRTPVIWDPAPCMSVVDRSVDTVIHLAYGIAEEDPARGEELSPDEVADSRTHQFFAYAREHPDFFFLPNWITEADVDAAAAAGLVDLADVDPEDVLESNGEWAGLWFRITQDADRRPITFAAAAAGVDWDTSALPAGTYTVQGYTHEPAFNLNVRRPGVIKVTDGGSPDAYGPAAAFEPGEILIYRDSTVVLRGCVNAMAGSTVTGDWAVLTAELDWTPFVEDLAIDGTELALDFAAPSTLIGIQGVVRATVRDPMGREYTAHRITAVSVLDGDDPNPCPMPCGTGDTSTGSDAGSGTGDETAGAVASTSTGTRESSTTDPAPATNTERPACDCAHRSVPASAIVTCGCVVVILRRRRGSPIRLPIAGRPPSLET